MLVCCIVMTSCFGIRIVLSVKRYSFTVITVPANLFICPSDTDQHFSFMRICRIVMISCILVVQSVYWCIALLRCRPSDSFIPPPGYDQCISFYDFCGIEVLSAVGIIQSVHGTRCFFRRDCAAVDENHIFNGFECRIAACGFQHIDAAGFFLIRQTSGIGSP